MFFAFSWLSVLALLALWSLAAWALHASAVWAVSHAGGLSGAASAAHTLVLPPWLTPWIPAEIAQAVSQMLAGLGPFVDGLLQAAPALAAGVTVVSWSVWGIGSALLLALGAGLHILIAVWRRRASAGSQSSAGRFVATR
ncbi:hypothetical protein [Caenimonas sp. SL110]|uniref:hypothetical protein n=1 Tax=Caenimonas sp. SL110 TaxID=1450524 RepID=UPI0006529739|nr:hypothetical protein [Caenimonas sp. SL110]